MVLSALLLLTTASPDLGFRIASAQEELAATLEQKRRWHRETLSLQCKLATYKPPVAKTTASAELEAARAAHVCDASASQQLPSEPPAEVGHADDHHGTGAAISGARLVRLEAKVAAAREQYLRWRKQAGLLHCELAERRGDKRPAGPHGGFCPTVAAKAGGAKTFTSNHNCIARGFAGWLARLFANKRVLDVGCGGGHCAPRRRTVCRGSEAPCPARRGTRAPVRATVSPHPLTRIRAPPHVGAQTAGTSASAARRTAGGAATTSAGWASTAPRASRRRREAPLRLRT